MGFAAADHTLSDLGSSSASRAAGFELLERMRVRRPTKTRRTIPQKRGPVAGWRMVRAGRHQTTIARQASERVRALLASGAARATLSAVMSYTNA
jgi:hypothetical protein